MGIASMIFHSKNKSFTNLSKKKGVNCQLKIQILSQDRRSIQVDETCPWTPVPSTDEAPSKCLKLHQDNSNVEPRKHKNLATFPISILVL